MRLGRKRNPFTRQFREPCAKRHGVLPADPRNGLLGKIKRIPPFLNAELQKVPMFKTTVMPGVKTCILGVRYFITSKPERLGYGLGMRGPFIRRPR